MSWRPRRALLGALALLVAVAAGPAGAQEPAPESPEQPVPEVAPTLELVERPRWARPVDQVTFAVTTPDAPDADGLAVQVEVFSALDSVEQLDDSAEEDVGVRLSLSPAHPLADLAPGPDGSRLVPLALSDEAVDDLTVQIISPGVHPVVLSLLGPDGEILDELRTPLVRLPDDDGWDAPDLAVVLDVDASPTLRPDGSRHLQPAELDRLAAAGAVLAAHPDLGITVAAVPDTVDALASSSDPAAAVVLDQLAGADVLAAPYQRLPVATLVDRGLEGLVAPLVERGSGALADRLGTEPRRGVWDGTHAPGDAGGRVLAELGYDRVLVPAPEPDEPADGDEPGPLVDVGPRPVRGAAPLLGLVVDRTLSAELARPADTGVDAPHRALARHLLRPADGPADGDDRDVGTVLVRPGPLADASVLAGLLGLLDHSEAPVRAGGLDLVARSEPPRAEGGSQPPAVTWRPSLDPDLGAISQRVLVAAAKIPAFAAMLDGRGPQADDVILQVATAIGADTSRPGRLEAVGAAEAALATALDGVVLTGEQHLNLTSRRGTLPVTVENRNPFAVDILVRLRSERLEFPDGDVIPVTVGESDLLRIDVAVEARATGSVPVFVDLLSPDGSLDLDTQRLNVRSTAVSGVGLVLSLGAVAVLATWWVRHILAVRRDRAGSGTDGDLVR